MVYVLRSLCGGVLLPKDVKKIVLANMLSLLAVGLASFAQAAPSTIGHKVEVRTSAGKQAVLAQGGRLIADYGGFQLYDVPQLNGPLPETANVRDSYNTVLLNAVHLDTSKPEVQALRKTVGTFTGKQMHLVQFAGPVQPAWRQSLLDAGVQIVSYVPQNAYLVYGDSASIARVQAMATTVPQIQWDAPYLNDYKIHPRARTVDKNGNPRKVTTDRFSIQMMADAAANADTLKLIDQLKLAPIERQSSVLHFVDVTARLSPADLPKIAARPDVLSIQPFALPKKVCERQDQIIAGNLSGNTPSGPGYLAWLQSKGFTQEQFTASGFIVDVSDSGIDNGTTAPNHFGLYDAGNISGSSRVAYNILDGQPNAGSTLSGCDGHGNLNAHIISGYDSSSGFPFLDSDGYHYGLGVCPFVTVGSSVIFDPDNSTDPDDTTVISTAYHFGARISNNSWGDSDPGDDGTYNADSQAYDALVRDAEPSGAPYTAAGNQEMVIVFAAGNDGPTNSSVSPPGTAKNVITVGGAQNVQPEGGCDSQSGVCDNEADDANSIVSFSSRGPCRDGRRKPDIVAPCTHVSGGVPQNSRLGPAGVGAALDCFLADGSGVSGGVGTNGGINLFFPDGQQFYTASSGTSHSTPAVTGGCALVRQYFINNGLPAPSPAMTKAFLMNSARYLTGASANDTLWSENQGMGEMDLGTAFDGTSRILTDEEAANTFTASGQIRTFTGTVGDSTKPFRVTIAWTDAPGNTTGDAYNNDLDLTVNVGGNLYKGNVFSGANSTTGGSADAKDNVESVFLPAGVSGTYTITVTAASINSVGVPSASDSLSQDFAMVIYNTAQTANVVAGGYTLTTNEPCTDGVVNAGETVTVNLALENAGSAATTNVVATLLTSNGVVLPSGPKTYGAIPAGGAATNAFTFLADGACGQTITATLQLQDGSQNLGTVSYNFQLGLPYTATNYAQNFDNTSTGTLPAGWSTATTGSVTGWTTVNNTADGTTNAAYCPDSVDVGESILYSPTITLPAGTNQLSFRNNFDLEDNYDGGVLEISIGGGAYTDIVTAGGNFVAGGYTGDLSDVGDSGNQDNPLINRDAWTGSSDGYITTVVALPAAASGTNVQFRWILGTDAGNSVRNLTGWFIDDIAISQAGFNCTNCSATAFLTPVILSPTNGYQLATNSPMLLVTGGAPVGSVVTIFDNGISNSAGLADDNGIFSIVANLQYGSNTLQAIAGLTNASSNAVVYLTIAPPSLAVATISNTNADVSGTGAPGATVYIYEGSSTNGTLVGTFLVNSSGSFSGVVALPLGSDTLTATETAGSQASGNSSPISINVVDIPAPAILLPTNGFVTSKDSVTVSGTGKPGSTVTISDVSIAGTATLAAPTVNSAGKFSATVDLTEGANALSASQVVNGTTSPSSATVAVGLYLSPVILAQPRNQTNFLGGTATFTADVVGAAPLALYWETNGVRIRGSTGAKLTLSKLKASAAEFSYSLVASNKYGVASSTAVTLTLVTNPFPNLAGTYYGLFAEPAAQFQSSGLLTLILNSMGSFSAKILSAGGSYAFSGALSGVGWGSNIVSRGAGLTPLTVVLNENVTNGGTQILGTVSEGAEWSAPLEADLATFSATKNPFPYPGKYSLIFASSNAGDGYGMANVSDAGMVSLTGVLSDNTSFAPSAVSVSSSGRWPLYIPLYGKFGSLAGWVDFTTNGGNGWVSTNAMWFRTNSDGKLYPGGFTNALNIVGSTFAPGDSSLLSAGNLEVYLSGGNLTGTLSNSVTLSSSGKFTVNGGGIPDLTLTFTPSTGVIKGGFIDPTTQTPSAIKGMVFQAQSNAAGFFLSGTNGGLFYLTPP